MVAHGASIDPRPRRHPEPSPILFRAVSAFLVAAVSAALVRFRGEGHGRVGSGVRAVASGRIRTLVDGIRKPETRDRSLDETQIFAPVPDASPPPRPVVRPNRIVVSAPPRVEPAVVVPTHVVT